ncbi:MAG: HAD family phosphatase [Candidatus Sericytochromatia bacterium]|nr:HAD family phosphatase [Candidatus Sericytochromatia bacterium]
MGYKLLVSDLDGTLVGHDHRLTPRTADACRALEAHGCAVTFATGRSWHGTLSLARELDLQTPVIAYQGAVARHHDGRPPLWHDTIPMAAAAEILTWLHRRQAKVSLCQGDEMILSYDHANTVRFLQGTGITVRIADRLHDELREAPTRIAIFGDPPEVIEWERSLQKAFPDGVRIGRSLGHLVEVTHPRATKGQAITRLAEWLGIAIHDVVACGDNFNDADMIATAGLGVAMSDAPPEILATAARVIPRQAPDGMADFLEELLTTLR